MKLSNMEMTKSEFLEYLTRLRSSLETDIKFVQKQLMLYKNAGGITDIDKAHLDWEVVHLFASYSDMKRDLERVIKTLEGKSFNAS